MTQPETPKVLARAVEVVTFLLAAFGGFFTNIAPPEETGIKLVLGVASVASLIVFLVISAAAKDLSKTSWLIIAGITAVVFVVGAVVYQQQLNKYTFTWTPTMIRYVHGGDQYTDDARPHAGQATPEEFMKHYGGIVPGQDNRLKVWTAESIRQAGLRLTILYLVTVLGAAASVFALTEGALARRAVSKAKPRSSAAKKQSH